MKTQRCLWILLIWLAGTSSAMGQAYVLSVSEGSGPPGSQVTLQVTADIDDTLGGLPLDGWSFGLCSNDAEVLPVQAQLGSAAAPLNPDFSNIDLNVAGGLTVGIVLDFVPPGPTLPVGFNQEILTVDYDVIGALGTFSLVTLCSTLGSPAVDVLVVATPANGAPLEIVPSTSIGAISIENPTPTAHLTVGTVQPVAGIATIPITLTHANSQGVIGFSFGLTWDGSALQGLNLAPGANLAAIRGGAGPVFFGVNLSPVGGTGLTLGMLTDFNVPAQALPLGVDQEVAVLTAAVVPPVAPAALIPIDFTTTLGSPPITLEVVAQVEGTSQSVTPTTTAGAVDLDVSFVRGDASGDGMLSIVDIVASLEAIFISPNGPDCPDTLDADDDGLIGILDVVFLLEHLFISGAPPAAPYPACGTDPTGTDGLGCNGNSVACP